MTYVATITSKRQFTIPIELFKKANLKTNQKVLVTMDKSGGFKVESLRNLVKELSGSVPLAEEYKGLSLNKMVEKARKNYYRDN